MSLGHGASVVRNGLVFQYDMSNTAKSWKGKPTTNYFSYPTAKDANGTDTLSNWSNFGFGDDNTLAISSDAPAIGNGNSVEVIANTTQFSTVNNNTTALGPLNLNDQITVSWYVKGVGNTIGKDVRIWAYANSPDGAVSTGLTGLGPLTSSWQRFSYTYTWTKTTASTSNFVTYIRVETGSGDSFLVSNPQVEIGPVLSTWVNGTRSNTQALIDISGSNNTVTVNSLSYNTDGSFEFDGTDDYISSSITNSSGDYIHSISFWMKLNSNQSSIPSRVDPFTIGNAANSSYSAMDISNVNVNWYFYNNDTRIASNLFLANTWYNIQLTYSGGGATTTNKKMYVNGVLQNWTTSSGTYYGDALNLPSNPNVSIGRDGGRTTAYFPGSISDFKIYSRTLTPEEVEQNFEATRGRYGI